MNCNFGECVTFEDFEKELEKNKYVDVKIKLVIFKVSKAPKGDRCLIAIKDLLDQDFTFAIVGDSNEAYEILKSIAELNNCTME